MLAKLFRPWVVALAFVAAVAWCALAGKEDPGDTHSATVSPPLWGPDLKMDGCPKCQARASRAAFP
jgi:hypothetical protein